MIVSTSKILYVTLCLLPLSNYFLNGSACFLILSRFFWTFARIFSSKNPQPWTFNCVIVKIYSKVFFCPKQYILGVFKGLFTQNCIFKSIILVKTMYYVQKRVFVQYCTCTDKGLSNQSACFGILPSPHPRIIVCDTRIAYHINYWFTCGGGGLSKCPADNKADDGIHAQAHFHNNNNNLFTFKFEATDHQPLRHVIIVQNCNCWRDFKRISVSIKFDSIQKPPQRFILSSMYRWQQRIQTNN